MKYLGQRPLAFDKHFSAAEFYFLGGCSSFVVRTGFVGRILTACDAFFAVPDVFEGLVIDGPCHPMHIPELPRCGLPVCVNDSCHLAARFGEYWCIAAFPVVRIFWFLLLLRKNPGASSSRTTFLRTIFPELPQALHPPFDFTLICRVGRQTHRLDLELRFCPLRGLKMSPFRISGG